MRGYKYFLFKTMCFFFDGGSGGFAKKTNKIEDFFCD